MILVFSFVAIVSTLWSVAFLRRWPEWWGGQNPYERYAWYRSRNAALGRAQQRTLIPFGCAGVPLAGGSWLFALWGDNVETYTPVQMAIFFHLERVCRSVASWRGRLRSLLGQNGSFRRHFVVNRDFSSNSWQRGVSDVRRHVGMKTV